MNKTLMAMTAATLVGFSGLAQAQTVLTLGLDQITKFVYRLDGPLGEGNV